MRISDWSSDVCSSDLMAIAREEIFGPVLSTLTFTDEDEAIRIANDTIYGLAAAVWTRSEERRVGKSVSRVDLGGRRIIKKKKQITHNIRGTNNNIDEKGIDNTGRRGRTKNEHR